MNNDRKKELKQAYKDTRPEMGVISLKNKNTKESFLGASVNTKADINSIVMKLSSGYHPNKRLLELWNLDGEEGFEIGVAEVLDSEDDPGDCKEEVELLREELLAKDSKASKIWK